MRLNPTRHGTASHPAGVSPQHGVLPRTAWDPPRRDMVSRTARYRAVHGISPARFRARLGFARGAVCRSTCSRTRSQVPAPGARAGRDEQLRPRAQRVRLGGVQPRHDARARAGAAIRSLSRCGMPRAARLCRQQRARCARAQPALLYVVMPPPIRSTSSGPPVGHADGREGLRGRSCRACLVRSRAPSSTSRAPRRSATHTPIARWAGCARRRRRSARPSVSAGVCVCVRAGEGAALQTRPSHALPPARPPAGPP